MRSITLIATTSFGLEAVVARELKQLGYPEQTIQDGRVTFVADEAAICRANLWLRSAERVMVKLGSFEARDFGQLFDETEALPWSDWIGRQAAFPVRARSVRSQLHSVPDCQSIVKKAIVEKLKKTYRQNWFDETGPTVAVETSILKDRVTLALDTTGPGLHKRGYRTLSGPAPLKETLAAALVQLSYWNAERPLVDPFCGTGTIVIEAAMIGRNIAPGLGRTFESQQWPNVPENLWEEARNEARDLQSDNLDFTLIGTDQDEKVLSLARYHAQQAGVEGNLHLQQKAFSDFTTNRKYGCIITNPPYGQRSGKPGEAEAIHRDMARLLAPLETWSVYVFTAIPNFERLYGRKADRRRKLYNGRIACTYYQFNGPPPPGRK